MRGYHQIFYVHLIPLFLIASHSPHPSSPFLLLCLLYRLTARVLGGNDEMGEAIGGSVQQQCWAGAFDGGGVGRRPAAARRGVTQQSNRAGGGSVCAIEDDDDNDDNDDDDGGERVEAGEGARIATRMAARR